MSIFIRLTEEHLVSDLVSHPAFRGFGVQLLPKPEYAASTLSLKYVGELMPWHNHVRGDVVVSALNAMIAQVKAGSPLFCPFYTDERKFVTGLFFFPGKKKAPFAVICPGGGFSYVGSLHEGFPVALDLSRRGYNAFVLNYQTGSGTVACQDLAHALTYIFVHADTFFLTREGYSLWGGSAGARMVAHMGSLGAQAYGGASLPKPAAVVMCYTGHSTCTKNDPPTIAFVGSNDTIADPRIMERRILSLQNAGIDAEFVLIPHVSHGFGLGVGTNAYGWVDVAVEFWEKQRKKRQYVR